MSRFGVKTLLTWYRTKPLCQNNIEYPGAYEWVYSDDLYVLLTRYCCMIKYSFSLSRSIQLTQISRNVELTYWNYDGSGRFFTIKYNDPNQAAFFVPDMARPLLQIPVTDIFTMFPLIVNMVKKN